MATSLGVAPRAGVGTFLALLARDVRVLRRTFKQFLIRTVMQPLLFTFVFAYLFPKIGQGVGSASAGGAPEPGSFTTVLVPGLLAVAAIFQGIQSVALPLTQEFSYTREIEDRVLSPIPVWAVALGKIVAGALQAVVAAAVVFPIVTLVHAKGEAPSIDIAEPVTFVVVLLLAAFMSASVGLLIGTSVPPQSVPLVFSIIVLPMTLLGCVYYPWSSLGPNGTTWVKNLVLVNPLVYMSEGFRAVLTPDVPHMPHWAFLGAMTLGTAVLATAAIRKFHDRVVA